MNEKELKKVTVRTVNQMIEKVEKGPSGFWVDDYEGCGNPQIFSEFRDGLKNGSYVMKEHCLCPWNTAVMYGHGKGNIGTGCYYSCSIKDAKYLSTEMLENVLVRFNIHLSNGDLDDKKNISALLTREEICYIEQQKILEKEERDRKYEQEKLERIDKSKKLTKRFKDNRDIIDLIHCNYGKNITVISEYGTICFSPESRADIVTSREISYDDYIEIQLKSSKNARHWFEMCYFNYPSEFKGKITKVNQNNICFEKIFVTGMYADDLSFFNGKEEHVWMDIAGFEGFNIGDCVAFSAEVYRYIKTNNGKSIDYSLRKPARIKAISEYDLPTDDELIMQGIDSIICETCMYRENCYGNYCIRNKNELKALRESMFTTIKDIQN